MLGICVLIMCALALWVLVVEFALVFIKPKKEQKKKCIGGDLKADEKLLQKRYIDDINALLDYTGDEKIEKE